MRRISIPFMSQKLAIGLKGRSIFAVLALGVTIAAAVGYIGFRTAREGLIRATEERLTLVSDRRASMVAEIFEGARRAVDTIAANAVVTRALTDFQGLGTLDDADRATLRAFFAEGKDLTARLSRDGTGQKSLNSWKHNLYSLRHSQYHSMFRAVIEQGGVDDVLLVDSNNNVIYTASKYQDFLQNIQAPELSQSGLAEVVKAARANTGVTVGVDFARYGSAEQEPSAFIARAVGVPSAAGDKAAPVAVVRLSASTIDRVLIPRTGLGSRGASFLIGNDFILRNRMPDGVTGELLATRVDTDATRGALAGQHGFAEYLSHEDKRVFGYYQSIDGIGTRYALIVEQPVDEALAAISDIGRSMWYGAAGAMVFAALGAFILGWSIATPIGTLTKTLEDIARGNLDRDIDGGSRRDEIGSIARAVAGIRDLVRAEAAQRDTQREEARTAKEEERRALLSTIAKDIESTVGSVVGTIAKASETLETSARRVTELTSKSQSRGQAVASSAALVDENIERMAHETDGLHGSIERIAEIVALSSTGVEQSSLQVKKTVTIVSQLTNCVDKIGQVTNLIEMIAQQTNLLALNATIEAARAGEAGKGFAVVAAEVKGLANQTSKATDVVTAQIEEMRVSTQTVVGAIGDINKVIAEIASAVSRVSTATEEQRTVTSNIAQNAMLIRQNTTTSAGHIADINQAIEDTDAAANAVMAESIALRKEAASLTNRLQGLLSQIRAA